jgi:hypothetical protein
MSKLLKALMAGQGYRDPAGEGKDGSTGGDDAAKLAAEKAAADKAAADKAAADVAAAGTKPSDAEAKLLKEVMEKKEKFEAERKARIEVENKLKEFDGIDPKAIKALLAEQTEREQKELAAKGEWDKLKAQMAEANGKIVAEKDAAIEAERNTVKTLNQQIADLTVGAAFSASQFLKEDLVLPLNKARSLYGSHFEYKDGKVIGYDQPAGVASRVPLVDSKGEPLGFEEAFKKIIDADPDKETILKSKTAPGAGSGTQVKPKPASSETAVSSDAKGLTKIQQALANKK